MEQIMTIRQDNYQLQHGSKLRLFIDWKCIHWLHLRWICIHFRI